MDRSLVVRERLADRLRAENGWTDKKWSDDEVIAKEDAQLEQKFPSMKHELEYQKDLWLFFRAQEREWNTIAMDEEGMRRQFENNKAKYIQQELSQGRKQPVTYRDVRGLVKMTYKKSVISNGWISFARLIPSRSTPLSSKPYNKDQLPFEF
jgi:hypothetical protein